MYIHLDIYEYESKLKQENKYQYKIYLQYQCTGKCIYNL